MKSKVLNSKEELRVKYNEEVEASKDVQNSRRSVSDEVEHMRENLYAPKKRYQTLQGSSMRRWSEKIN